MNGMFGTRKLNGSVNKYRNTFFSLFLILISHILHNRLRWAGVWRRSFVASPQRAKEKGEGKNLV